MKNNNIFNILFLVILTFAFIGNSEAQAKSNSESNNLLAKASKKIKEMPAVEIDFSLVMENKAENIKESYIGKAYMKKNLYRLEVMDVINYFDGKAIYSYMPDMEEVTIKNPTENQSELLNPTQLFDIYKRGFTSKLISKKAGIAYIELTPIDDTKTYTKIGIWVDMLKNNVTKVTSFGKEGNNVIITINSIRQPKSIPMDSFFKFDTSCHTNVEVVDER